MAERLQEEKMGLLKQMEDLRQEKKLLHEKDKRLDEKDMLLLEEKRQHGDMCSAK